MTIKPLYYNDSEKICSLYSKDFPDGWNKKMTDSAFKEGRFVVFGCFINEELIGVICLTKGLDFGDIEEVYVLKERRKCGVAKLLMERAISYFDSVDIHKILLEVRESNIKAINLYKKFGFNIISKRKKYYSDGEDALVMERESC